jgi:hypothetical protein
MSSHLLDDHTHWRARAEEARRLAAEMTDVVSRTMMLNVAEDYDNVANRAELRHRGNRVGQARSKAEDYREKARECDELATACNMPDVQQSLLDLAAEWRVMASRLEGGESPTNV